MRNVVAAVFVASLLVVGVAAQNQPPATQGQPPATQGQPPSTQGEPPAMPSQQPSTPRQQPATTQASKVTISGCIQNAPPAATTPGAAPSAAASKFDLASAKVVSGGPVGTSGAAATATRYRLEGEEKTITPHLNHQVEITGTLSSATATGATAAPTLKVESVKMVAAKCP